MLDEVEDTEVGDDGLEPVLDSHSTSIGISESSILISDSSILRFVQNEDDDKDCDDTLSD